MNGNQNYQHYGSNINNNGNARYNPNEAYEQQQQHQQQHLRLQQQKQLLQLQQQQLLKIQQQQYQQQNDGHQHNQRQQSQQNSGYQQQQQQPQQQPYPQRQQKQQRQQPQRQHNPQQQQPYQYQRQQEHYTHKPLTQYNQHPVDILSGRNRHDIQKMKVASNQNMRPGENYNGYGQVVNPYTIGREVTSSPVTSYHSRHAYINTTRPNSQRGHAHNVNLSRSRDLSAQYENPVGHTASCSSVIPVDREIDASNVDVVPNNKKQSGRKNSKKIVKKVANKRKPAKPKPKRQVRTPRTKKQNDANNSSNNTKNNTIYNTGNDTANNSNVGTATKRIQPRTSATKRTSTTKTGGSPIEQFSQDAGRSYSRVGHVYKLDYAGFKETSAASRRKRFKLKPQAMKVRRERLAAARLSDAAEPAPPKATRSTKTKRLLELQSTDNEATKALHDLVQQQLRYVNGAPPDRIVVPKGYFQSECPPTVYDYLKD